MKKQYLLIAFRASLGVSLALALICGPQELWAAKKKAKKLQPAPIHKETVTHKSQKNDTPKTWGVGALTGTDIGFSTKYWLKTSMPLAAQGAFGYDFSGFAFISSDLLYHFKNLTQLNLFAPGDLHGYVGGGVKVDFGGPLFIRIPIGANLVFHQEPFDMFLETAPSVRVIPSTGVNLDIVLGARYYFM